MMPGKFLKYLSIVAFLFYFGTDTKSQTLNSPNCQKALFEILQFNYNSAANYLEAERKISPKNLYIFYLQHYALFLKVVFDESPNDILAFEELTESLSQKNNKYTDSSTVKLLIISEINLKASVVYAKLNERIKALKYLMASEKYLADFINKYPNSPEINKILPVILLTNKYLPQIIRHFTPVAFTDKNAFQLLNEYKNMVSADSIKFLECTIIQLFLNYQFSGDLKQGFTMVEKSHQQFPNQPLLMLAYSLFATKVGKSEEALKSWEHINSHNLGELPCFYKYIESDLKLNLYQDGEGFSKFLQCYYGNSYIKSALLKWSYFRLLAGDTSEYIALKKKIKVMGIAENDADKFAIQQAVNLEIPNVKLLNANMLFDGGLYNNARRVLLQDETISSLKNTKDRIEYFYRFGRINQEEGDFNAAKAYYLMVLKYGKELHNYFAANSALQLALIYEQEKDFTLAKTYFEMCLTLNKYDYVNSIGTKANLGLARINRSK